MSLVDVSALPKPVKSATAHSLTAFGLDLFAQLNKANKGKNLFFSPFSISTALALVYAGTNTHTKEEIAKSLHVTQSDEDFHLGFSALLQQAGLAGAGSMPGVSLSVANGLWIESSVRIKKAYLDLTQANYAAAAENCNFKTQAETERAKINGAIAKATHDLIPELLPSGSVTADTVAVLTNAIYFKGIWSKTFDPAHTTKAHFKIFGTKNTVDAQLMFLHTELKYKHAGAFQAVELPYGAAGAGSNLSMVVLLPEDNTAEAFDAVAATLNYEGFKKIVSQMHEVKVKLHLPKFELEQQFKLNDVLQSLGLNSIFSSSADFTNLTHMPLTITDVLHKAVVKVNEEGTEAAAATAVIAKRSMSLAPEPIVYADHPFLFFIWDRSVENVLFLGQVVDPTA